MNYGKKLFRGAIFALLSTLSAAGLGYLFRILLARNLTVEEFGLFFAVFSFVGFFYGFKGFGLGSAVVRFIVEERVKNSYASIKKIIFVYFIIQAIIFGFVSVLLLIFSDYLAQIYFKNGDAFLILIVLTIAFIFNVIFTTLSGVFHGFNKINYMSITEFLQIFVVFIFTYFMFLNHGGILTPAYAYLVSFAVVSVVSIYLTYKILPDLHNGLKFDKLYFKKLISFGSPVFIGTLSSSVILYFGTLALTYFGNIEEVAFYSIALPTANLLKYIPKALTISFLPISSELDLTNKSKLANILSKTYEYLLLMMIPLALILFSFSEFIISILFGNDYMAASNALKILAIAMIFNALTLPSQFTLLGLNKPIKHRNLAILGAVVNVVLNIALIPKYGIIGASMAFLFSSFVLFIFYLIETFRLTKAKIKVSFWIKSILVSFLFLFLTNFFKGLFSFSDWINFLLSCLASLVIYLVFLIMLRMIKIKEIKELILNLEIWRK